MAKITHDEFYTLFEDVENELKHYDFNNAVVWCPCDDALHSSFYRYFILNFHELGLKKIICSCYGKHGKATVFDGEIECTYCLHGTGAFDTDEVKPFLNECDFIVTNPPFSKFEQITEFCIENKKRFILLGFFGVLYRHGVFEFLFHGNLKLGYTRNKSLEFIVPDWCVCHKENNGVHLVTLSNVVFFTNIDIDKQVQFKSKIKLSDYPFQKYDNFDAWFIPSCSMIPNDCFDLLAVPFTYLTIHDETQFQIVGRLHTYTKNEPELGKFCGEKVFCQSNGKWIYTTCGVLNGKAQFTRILIKRKINGSSTSQ